MVRGTEVLSVFASPAKVEEVPAVDCRSNGSSGATPIGAQFLREVGDAYTLAVISSVGLLDDTGVDWAIGKPSGGGLLRTEAL